MSIANPIPERPTREQVQAYLDRLREFVLRQEIVYVRRREVMELFGELGITFDTADDVLMRLKVSDYCDGPLEDDQGREGDVWVFGAQEFGMTLYIKFRMTDAETFCVSFHRPRYRMHFPYA